MCLVAWFLYKVQGSSDDDTRGGFEGPPVIHTDIFDLYDEEWAPIVSDLQEAFKLEYQEEINNQGEATLEEEVSMGRVSRKEVEASWWGENSMFMHPGDLRRPAPDLALVEATTLPPHDQLLLNTVLNTDVFICQFVLHENASFLVNEETGLLVGFVASVLEGARRGAMLVCTDSGNTLWPALKKTATLHGWKYWSDSENAELGRKIVFGPKAFVIMERVSTC
jgi:hypothetical protein